MPAVLQAEDVRCRMRLYVIVCIRSPNIQEQNNKPDSRLADQFVVKES